MKLSEFVNMLIVLSFKNQLKPVFARRKMELGDAYCVISAKIASFQSTYILHIFHLVENGPNQRKLKSKENCATCYQLFVEEFHCNFLQRYNLE